MNDLRERFETQMLLVFYVAESQRFDRIAAVRDQIIRARSGVVRATPQSDFRDWAMSALFKNFGSASATVRRAVSAQWRGPSATVARPTDPGAREPTPQRLALLLGDTRQRDPVLAVRGIKPLSASLSLAPGVGRRSGSKPPFANDL